jgi:hypothetical protein
VHPEIEAAVEGPGAHALAPDWLQAAPKAETVKSRCHVFHGRDDRFHKKRFTSVEAVFGIS